MASFVPTFKLTKKITLGLMLNGITINNGQWVNGAKVEIISVNGGKYLRTDRNNTPKDNLGSLPEF